MKTLHLEEQESLELIRHYTKELEKIDERRLRIINILSQLNSSLSDAAKEVSNDVKERKEVMRNSINSFTDKSYSIDWTWTQKITYVLKQKEHPLTKKEILTELKNLDHQIAQDHNLAQRSVGATLSRQTKNGKFKVYEDSKKDFNAYALPEWFEANGQLGIEY